MVPAEFVATSLKWYVVPGVTELREADTATGLEPEPALASTAGDCEPYAVVVPYSKWYVVASLSGFTLPLREVFGELDRQE